jgi:hypothetical protein
MRQILYVSVARPDLAPDAVEEILSASRRNNAAAGITGLLLEIDQAFLQVLEGDAQALKNLMATIRRDPRHANIGVLLERDVAARAFPHWTMGFKRPRTDEVPETAFRITRAALDDRLNAIEDRDITALIESFCMINAREFGRAS